MNIDEELAQKNKELKSVRLSIDKLLSNGGVLSYAVAGSSVNYRSLDELRKNETLILNAISKLEHIKKGKKDSAISLSFRVA